MPELTEEAGVEVVGPEATPPTGLMARLATARIALTAWAIHASGRFDRTDASWVAAFRRYVRRALVLTGTEAAGRDPGVFRKGLAGVRGVWASVHLTGAAAGECWAAWDTRALQLEHAAARKLTDLTWTRAEEYGGKTAAKVHALVVRLRKTRGRRKRRVIFVVVHMPLDNTPQRAAVWVDCCRGLRALVAELEAEFPDAVVILVGDWNKNLRQLTERMMVHRHLLDPLGMVTSWHRGLPKGGTLVGGASVIDYAIAKAWVLGRCTREPATKASDHIAIRYQLLGWLRRLLNGAPR